MQPTDATDAFVIPFVDWTGWNIQILKGPNGVFLIQVFPRYHYFGDENEQAVAEWIYENGCFRENSPWKRTCTPLKVRDSGGLVVVGPFDSLAMYEEFRHQVVKHVLEGYEE